MEDRIVDRPDPRLMAIEAPRVLSEISSLFPAAPFLMRAPMGDGHPVLVLPGLGAGDVSTRVLRGFLRTSGYDAYGWKLVRNLGPAMPDLTARLGQLLEDVFEQGGDRKLSIVGWSLVAYMRDCLPTNIRTKYAR